MVSQANPVILTTHSLQNIYKELTGLKYVQCRLRAHDRTNDTQHYGTGFPKQLVQTIQGYVDGL